jgi:HTH domain
VRSLDHPLIRAIRPIADAMGARVLPLTQREPSDLALQWDGEDIAVVRLAPLHGALDRLIEGVERDMGGRLRELTREEKQRAVRMLDERGAFILRRAVEDVADAMNVSRITVYNYLNAIHR